MVCGFRRIVVLWLVGTSLVTSVGARAQTTDQSLTDDRRRYDRLVEDAVSEFSAGRFPEALALFERAHRVRPSARTLRGIGITAFELRDYPRAHVALRESLESRVQPLTSRQRLEVESLLARTDEFVGRIEIVGAPENAEILVDGAPPVLEGSVVLVGPGRHQVVVRTRAGANWSHTVDATGTTETLEVTFVPSEREAEDAIVADDEANGRDLAPWWTLGASATVAVTGVVIGSVALSHARMADTREDDARARRLARTGDSLIAIGSAASIGGLVWGLVARRHDRSDESAPAITIDPSPGGAAVRWTGTF